VAPGEGPGASERPTASSNGPPSAAPPLRRWAGAGHAPPSKAVILAPPVLVGAQNHDIEFAEVAWALFTAHLPD